MEVKKQKINESQRDKPESTILGDCLVELSETGFTVFRNSVGTGWLSNLVTYGPGFVTLKYPRKITFGLGEGSSDIVGFYSLKITEEMIGKTVPVFCAIETKTKTGRATEKQNKFLQFIDRSGGFAALVRDKSEIKTYLTQYLTKLKSGR